MRRKEREVTEISDITAILDKCEVLRLGLSDNNKPYVVPMNFGYEEKDGRLFVYLHGAKEGKKIGIILKNDNVCFETDCSYKTIEAAQACGWSAEYQSIIGEGTIKLLDNNEDKIQGLNTIMKHYGFNGTPGYPPQALAEVAVMRIEISSITGKQRIKT